jgi:tetratricopeptide (TPR) repeat protein
MPAVPDDSPPSPTAQGTFAKTPLPQVLVYVLERQLTGTIEIVAPGGETPRWAKLLVLDGQPAKMQTGEAVAYLGNVLLQLGYITGEQLNMSLAQLSQSIAGQRRLHGQILLEAGAIDHAQLVQALRVQLAQKIEHLLDWPPETQFAYYDGYDALRNYGADEDVLLDSLPLVWAAIRQQPPWEHVHATLTRVGNTPMRIALHAELDRFDFQKDERATVELLRDQSLRVHELVACKTMGAAATQLLAYCLLITKQVDLVAMSEAAPSQRVARVQLQQVAQKGVIEERHQPSRSDSRVASPLPPPNAPPPQASPAAPNEPPPGSGRKISVSKMEAAQKTKSGRSAIAPVHEARRKEIVERAAAIKSQNYFEMLGVDKDASVEQIQNAFFQLAKIWHPDRVPAFLADVKDLCASVFSHMSEAHQTLLDPKRRDQYMHLLKDGGATPDDQAQIALVIDAATNFQKAEICLRRSDLVQAEALVRKAHEGDPKQPEYMALLAWLESMKPENQAPEATLACIEKLDEAIVMNERCERAYFYRGMLNKRVQNVTAAVRDFRRASELNPRNIDAVREVRLFEMRKSRTSAPPPPSKGPSGKGADSERTPPGRKRRDSEPSLSKLFGKLFKK